MPFDFTTGIDPQDYKPRHPSVFDMGCSQTHENRSLKGAPTVFF